MEARLCTGVLVELSVIIASICPPASMGRATTYRSVCPGIVQRLVERDQALL
jgi:hypothetical protein